MLWVDVAGPPGVGKSTLCDPIWGPHQLPIKDLPPPPHWHDFVNEVTRLMMLVREHPSFVAAVRMNRRSMRKMATVGAVFENSDATGPAGPYIQTGFVQRGLGFGWRLTDMGKDISELVHFFRLMPASIGVAFLKAPADTVAQRNKERERVAKTAHENRAFMVPLMQPALELANEVLNGRGVPTIHIDTSRPVDDCRKDLLEFAARNPRNLAPHGSSRQGPILSPPDWW